MATAIDSVSFIYDAFGRVAEAIGGSTTYENLYGPTGGRLAQMNGQSLVRGFVSLPGGDTAIYDTSVGGALYYYRHSDWLGSSRIASGPTGSFTSTTAYAPYGEKYASLGGDTSFTGQNSEYGSDLYDFPAREYSDQGRWPSPDPAGVGAVDPANPQSWNRYAYVNNNPLAVTDPSGMGGIQEGNGCDFFLDCGGSWCIFGCGFGFPEGDGGGGGERPAVPPHAPAPPPGGYGAGIDPYGTWDEKLPAGVQVFPSGFPGLNLPGGGGSIGGTSLIPCVDGPPTPD